MALRKSGQILAPKISRVLRQELVCIDSLGQNQSHHCLSFKSLSAPPTPHQSFETEKIYTKLSIHTCLAPFAEPITAPNKWTSVREITTSKQVNRHFHSSTVGNKDIKVEIQAMGESISEGTIAEVLKSEGDGVEEDETIAQIETDKVTIDVKAPSAGTIKELTVRGFLLGFLSFSSFASASLLKLLLHSSRKHKYRKSTYNSCICTKKGPNPCKPKLICKMASELK